MSFILRSTIIWSVINIGNLCYATNVETLVPQYSDYAVNKIYQGPNAEITLESRLDRMFRSNLRAAAKRKPNFAGEYVLTRWGCGGRCVSGAVINIRTGKVIHFPSNSGDWRGDSNRELIEFRLDSRLVVYAGWINQDTGGGIHGLHFYEITDDGFKFVKTISVPQEW